MSQPAAVSARLPVWAIVAGAGAIVGMAMGLRQVMGLYLQPMTTQLGVGRESFSTAMAVANLVWGIGAVFSGAIADKFGAARVVIGGALCTMAGLYVMYSARNGADLLASGASVAPALPRWWARLAVRCRLKSAPRRLRRSAWPAVSAASSRFPMRTC
jgi:hypothetical protein